VCVCVFTFLFRYTCGEHTHTHTHTHTRTHTLPPLSLSLSYLAVQVGLVVPVTQSNRALQGTLAGRVRPRMRGRRLRGDPLDP